MGGSLGQEGPGDTARGVRPGALSALLQEIAGAPTPSGGVSWEPALRPGLTVGKFELVRELGSGGFGVVWEARDRELGRVVAFKAVRAGAKDRLREERLLREAEAAARLSHPNLVTLHDLGHSEHGPYLVLELLRGQTLEKRLDQGRLSLREAVRVGADVAKGVAHAHSHGVVHRDLKPSNVFLCDDGQVKVLDFGLAHAFGQRRQDGGTPAYMAPEQWEGAPEDERTDVFALGVMLFGMLSGELPFPEDGGRSVQGRKKAPLLEVPELPALGELVARMLEKRAAQRPRDGAEVAAALTSLHGELERTPATGAPPVTTRPRAGLPGLVSELRRRKVLPALVGYVTFALVAVKGVDWLHDSGRLPGWGLTAALALLGLGFPATLIAAWFYDLTGQGFRRAASEGTDAAGSRRARLALLIAGLAVLAAVPSGTYFLLFRDGRLKPGAEARAQAGQEPSASIAVLPFADLSPSRDQEYFADGVAEEILNALSKVEGLRVPGRASCFWFKGKSAEPAEIGRKLGVAHILEGSVRRSGNKLRISAEVVKVASGERLWRETFDRELTDIFNVQDEIAKATVEALKVRLLPGGAAPVSASRTGSAEAYRLYLLGQELTRRGTLDGDRRAAAALEKALELDPSYASAAAALSSTLVAIWRKAGQDADVEDVARRARAAAERAIALAPRSASGFVARAWVRFASWDWAGADADARQALALEPSDLPAHRFRSWLLSISGRLDEAVAAQQRNAERDPLNAVAWNSLGWQLLATGRLAPARAALAKALELEPEFDYATGNLAISYLLEGKPAEALAIWEQCGEPRFRLLGRALAQSDLGSRDEAERSLSALVERFGEQLPYRVAEVHAWRGDRDAAFAWLERSFAQRDPNLAYLREDPLVAKIRGDARYGALLRRMGVPSP